MSEQVKPPGFSNEEFIKKWRRMTMSDLSLAQRRGEDAEAFWRALDRLEARLGNYDKAFEGCRALVELGEPVPVEKYEAAILAMMDLKEERDALVKANEETKRKAFEAGYEAFCTKHYTLDQAWEAFAAAADAAKKEGGK